ncbi:MAG TPA: NAD(P)-binding protein [Steroidobacteraceae bacterium]
MNSDTDAGALGSAENPLHVAIVGSGPSGFYAAEALLKSSLTVRVDMIERLPVPFGLVRYGVAPDHPRLKQPTLVFDKIAQSPGFTFLGNVTVGRDISLEQLQSTHHAVLFACGAESDRRLGLANEDLPGSHTATEFVGWYNGHPDYCERTFDLSSETAVIIGQGNVAIDVARILGKSVDELRSTDMAEHALDALAHSRVRDIHIIGRRSPAQASFTFKELRELGELRGCVTRVAAEDLQLNPASLAELEDKTNFNAAKNVEILQSWTLHGAATADKRIWFHFLQSPVALSGKQRLERVTLEKNSLAGPPFGQTAQGTGVSLDLSCGLLFRSIGYRGLPLPGVPFDATKGVFPNTAGRISDTLGLYAAGWIKRGPSGIIGTNRADAVASVQSLLADVPRLDSRPKSGSEGVYAALARIESPVLSYGDWRRIDAEEQRRGEAIGKPREKITRVSDMLALAASPLAETALEHAHHS